MQALEANGLTVAPWGELADEDFGLGSIGAGDLQAFELLYHKYYSPLAHFLSLLLPTTPTRDLCEQIFAEVWNQAGACPRNLAALTFVLRIGLEAAAVLNSGSPAAAGGGGAEIRRKLGELQWEQRLVATLVYGLGLPLQTIAQVTAMSDQEICSHLAGARQQLGSRAPNSDPKPT